MLVRVPEPEVMESSEDAIEYDAMDHADVNRAFVCDFLAAVRKHGLEARLRDRVRPLAVLDAGTGTARIPILLGRQPVFTRPTVVDLSENMLMLARRNVYAAGLQFAIKLQRADCAALPFADGSFDAVMSNSIVHHLSNLPAAAAEMVRVLRPGGLLFVRDLRRPESEEALAALVATHAAGATDRQRTLLTDSLRAALTTDEARSLFAACGLPPEAVRETSDRHWTAAGVPRVSVAHPSNRVLV